MRTKTEKQQGGLVSAKAVRWVERVCGGKDMWTGNGEFSVWSEKRIGVMDGSAGFRGGSRGVMDPGPPPKL